MIAPAVSVQRSLVKAPSDLCYMHSKLLALPTAITLFCSFHSRQEGPHKSPQDPASGDATDPPAQEAPHGSEEEACHQEA